MMSPPCGLRILADAHLRPALTRFVGGGFFPDLAFFPGVVVRGRAPAAGVLALAAAAGLRFDCRARPAAGFGAGGTTPAESNSIPKTSARASAAIVSAVEPAALAETLSVASVINSK